MGKRTKGHDRDKYYHLAKDQGYRARSAFKLIEINKKHDILSTARVVIDLCAAPGSWCQVAQKAMPSGGLVIGVDLLPIRPIRGVKTLISDITTEDCRRQLHREMQTWKADAVLCDGAPNVGAAYSKDAYVQNEIALAALKVATQHLAKGGAFVTKVYRSQDYNALVWVLQHFFEEYHAVKPASSRSQSAEIFLVGLNYRDPATIDPKMLDPRAVFDQSHEESAKKGVTIFHKKFEQHNKRQRGGYDDDLGPTLSRVASVTSFVDSVDPIRMLTDCNQFKFEEGCEVFRSSALTTPDVLRACEDLKVLGKTDFKHLLKWRTKMREYRDELAKAGEDSGSDDEGDGDAGKEGGEGEGEEAAAPVDSDEEEEQVQEEIRDLRLKVLAENKRRRKKEREAAARLRQRAAMGMESAAIELPEDEAVFTLASLGKGGTLQTLDELREANLAGMRASDVGCVSGDEEDEDAAADSSADSDSDNGSDGGDPSDSGEESDVEKNMQLEEELEAAYQTYLTGRNKESLEGTRTAKRTKLARANKAAAEQQEDVAMYNMDGDKHAYLKMLAGQDGSGADADSSDDDANDIDSSDEDDGVPNGTEEEDDDGAAAAAFDSDDDGGDGAAAAGEDAAGIGRNPLLTDLLSDKARRKERTSRWFANPLFEGVVAADADMGEAEQLLMLQQQQDTADIDETTGAASAAGATATAEQRLPKRQRREQAAAAAAARSKKAAAVAANALGTVSFGNGDAAAADSDDGSDSDAGGAAAAVLASMPKSDKQLRKEKRKKAMERRERKEARKHPELEEEQDLQVVAADEEMADMTPQQKARMLRKRELIRQGMGNAITDDGSNANNASAGGGSSTSGSGRGGENNHLGGFDAAKAAALAGMMRGANGAAAAVAAGAAAGDFSIVPALERKDERTYDSGSEGYDDEDRANQLALGTMMLRKHRQKALVDAAYNRYAWNDDKDLPSWFVDDEQKHYRPQLPIPKALLEQMKRKFLSLAAKPIKKVAEARLRKRKRATDKLKAARKKAEALAQNPDISERQKVKAVQQAMRRGGVSADKPSKVYVVAKKSGGSSGSSGSKAKGARVKMVDSRMKKDKRGEKRAAKKRKGGKGGGGGKRRKH